MSTLSSASTLAQIEAAYDDNASYAEDNSVAKCRGFITACRLLLRRTPHEAGHGEGRVRLTADLIAKELEQAKDWLATHSTSTTDSGPRVTRVSFNDFR